MLKMVIQTENNEINHCFPTIKVIKRCYRHCLRADSHVVVLLRILGLPLLNEILHGVGFIPHIFPQDAKKFDCILETRTSLLPSRKESNMRGSKMLKILEL